MAYILVDGKGMIVIEKVDAFIQLGMLQALVDGVVEEFDVCIQRELVHWINTPHIIHNKEQYGGSLGTRPVSL